MKGNRGGGRHPNGHPWRRMGSVKAASNPKRRRSAEDMQRIVDYLARRRDR